MTRARRLSAVLTSGLVIFVAATVVVAIAQSNWVPASHAHDESRLQTANDLKPPECAGILLTVTVTGSGTFSGTPAGDLIAGRAGADVIEGLLESDCILGGDGDDQISGGLLGNDVCIGGPGDDTFTGCEIEIQ